MGLSNTLEEFGATTNGTAPANLAEEATSRLGADESEADVGSVVVEEEDDTPETAKIVGSAHGTEPVDRQFWPAPKRIRRMPSCTDR